MRWRGVVVIAKKELSSIWSERTILFAIFLQLFMATFSSVLVIGLGTIYDPSSVAGLGQMRYSIAISGENQDIEVFLAERGDLLVYRMDLSTAIAALKERRIAAVLYATDVPLEGDEPVRITLYTLRHDISSTVVVAKLREALLKYEEAAREARSSRLSTVPLPLEIPEGRGGLHEEIVYTLLIPLLLFLPAIISAGLAIDQITEEYQQNTLETLLSSPLTLREVIWGKISAAVLLVPLQVVAWLLLLMLNRVRIASPAAILAVVLLTSLPLILMGAVLALHYRERTNAQLVFSIGVILAILLALALPVNPINAVVRLALGTAGIEWLLLPVPLGTAALACALLVERYAEHGRRPSPATSS